MPFNISNTYNMTRAYSPIVLNTEWSALWRMMLMIGLSIVGSITNGFFVSSFFIELGLRTTGQVYLACVGLADMIVTSVMLPVASAVLISKVWDLAQVCYTLQFLGQASVYIYNMIFMMVAVENYIKICRTRACYYQFLDIRVGFVSVLIYFIGIVASGIGVYFGMDYDYCTRASYGNLKYRLISALIFQVLPFTVTVLLLVTTSFVLHARTLRLARFKRSKMYARDYAFTKLHLGCYLLYVAAWLPYLVIVNQYPYTSDANYYNCAWIGLSRSFVTSFIYSCLNRYFRHAFSYLFCYCCCKSNVTAPYNHRHRRAAGQNAGPTRGDVKVHIMHHLISSSKRSKRSVGSVLSRTKQCCCDI